jgi:hypothetical protein
MVLANARNYFDIQNFRSILTDITSGILLPAFSIIYFL